MGLDLCLCDGALCSVSSPYPPVFKGHDILLGDIGYCIRRYNGTQPLGNSNGVWHKDIVLEELGNITKSTRISHKVNTAIMDAETIAAASLLFVANAYNDDGTKYLNPDKEWISDLFVFDLVNAYDDSLDGGGGNDGKWLIILRHEFSLTWLNLQSALSFS